MPTPLSPPSSLPRSPDPSEALHTYRECDLRQLARTITENVELYLQSLESHGQMPPTFFPDSEYGISQDGSGKAAQRALIDAAERIIALTTGPPGLYGISRQVSRSKRFISYSKI